MPPWASLSLPPSSGRRAPSDSSCPRRAGPRSWRIGPALRANSARLAAPARGPRARMPTSPTSSPRPWRLSSRHPRRPPDRHPREVRFAPRGPNRMADRLAARIGNADRTDPAAGVVAADRLRRTTTAVEADVARRRARPVLVARRAFGPANATVAGDILVAARTVAPPLREATRPVVADLRPPAIGVATAPAPMDTVAAHAVLVRDAADVVERVAAARRTDLDRRTTDQSVRRRIEEAIHRARTVAAELVVGASTPPLVGP